MTCIFFLLHVSPFLMSFCLSLITLPEMHTPELKLEALAINFLELPNVVILTNCGLYKDSSTVHNINPIHLSNLV